MGDGIGEHCASLTRGRPGILHGACSYLLQNDEGQVVPTHSVSAGLDYPGVGPEHSFWKESGRVEYVTITDRQALEAFVVLSRSEGIIPALESAHAVAWCENELTTVRDVEDVVIVLSGRGDKDVAEVQHLVGDMACDQDR